MYPAVGKVDLHTVDVVHFGAVVLGEHLLYLDEDGVYIGLWSEVDAILRYLIIREGFAQFAGGAALLCQCRQEEHDANQCITAVVALGIDDATIAFAADDGSHFLHLCSNIDLAHSGSIILATIFLSNISQSAG